MDLPDGARSARDQRNFFPREAIEKFPRGKPRSLFVIASGMTGGPGGPLAVYAIHTPGAWGAVAAGRKGRPLRDLIPNQSTFSRKRLRIRLNPVGDLQLVTNQ